jgi:hypothetical protein
VTREATMNWCCGGDTAAERHGWVVALVEPQAFLSQQTDWRLRRRLGISGSSVHRWQERRAVPSLSAG